MIDPRSCYTDNTFSASPYTGVHGVYKEDGVHSGSNDNKLRSSGYTTGSFSPTFWSFLKLRLHSTDRHVLDLFCRFARNGKCRAPGVPWWWDSLVPEFMSP